MAGLINRPIKHLAVSHRTPAVRDLVQIGSIGEQKPPVWCKFNTQYVHLLLLTGVGALPSPHPPRLLGAPRVPAAWAAPSATSDRVPGRADGKFSSTAGIERGIVGCAARCNFACAPPPATRCWSRQHLGAAAVEHLRIEADERQVDCCTRDSRRRNVRAKRGPRGALLERRTQRTWARHRSVPSHVAA